MTTLDLHNVIQLPRTNTKVIGCLYV